MQFARLQTSYVDSGRPFMFAVCNQGWKRVLTSGRRPHYNCTGDVAQFIDHWPSWLISQYLDVTV
jgi:hypothetical protein